jgi:ubiquinone/menaquinone biosynthesis C-methylase UbiE
MHCSLLSGRKIIAFDLSPGMIKQASARGAKEGWKGVELKILDATDMTGIQDASCSHILSASSLQ